MRSKHRLSILALASVYLSPAALAQTGGGQLYTLTNETSGNRVAVYDRAADGALTFNQFVATGGLGTGEGLGNQGAVVLSDDQRFLLAVNAGSNDLSVFAVAENGLVLVDVEASNGTRPVSITQRGSLVFVLNAGSSSISGFRLGFNGDLHAIPGAEAVLSAMDAAPAQIGFGPRGDHLYVTERATDRIARFTLNRADRPGQGVFMDSPGQTPFGFAFGRRGHLIVSEAAGGAPGASTATSYVQLANGSLAANTVSVGAGQAAACWIVVTPDGRLAFTSNTADDTITSFQVGFDGSLSVLAAVSANVGDGPTDMAVTPDGRFFYVLNAAAGTVSDYAIGSDGSLTGIPGSTAPRPGRTTGGAVR